MANEKDLALLTIDGVSMRNLFTDKNIGSLEASASWTGSKNCPANTQTNIGNSLTIDEDGAYLVSVTARIGGSSTGNYMQQLNINLNGTGAMSTSCLMANNTNARVSFGWIYSALTQNDVIQLSMFPSAATVCTAARIYAIKLAKYPGIE